MYKRYPSYSFNSSNSSFNNINACSAIEYIRFKPYLTVSDMFAFNLSTSTTSNKPEFYEEYDELWKKYKNYTAEWKQMCKCFKDYFDEKDVIAVFSRKNAPHNGAVKKVKPKVRVDHFHGSLGLLVSLFYSAFLSMTGLLDLIRSMELVGVDGTRDYWAGTKLRGFIFYIHLYIDVTAFIIAPPTKPCHQILDIKKISLRQKNLKCESIPAFFFLDKFPFCLRLFGKV